MSNVNPVSPLAGNVDASGAVRTPKNELSPDDFMKLFLAQMKNQNPAHPADSSAILQQMAAIGSIKSSNEMQKSLADLSQNVNMSLANSQVLESTQLIGKHVEIPSASAPLVKDEGLSGSAMVPQAATSVKVAIKDASGNVVKTINCGAAASGGLVDFKWDGVGDDGKQCDPNFYSMSATATINNHDVNIKTAGSFKVNSVALNQKTGGIILNVDGLGGTDMGDIIKIL